VSQGGFDDRYKAASFVGNATPRRSTSSLGEMSVDEVIDGDLSDLLAVFAGGQFGSKLVEPPHWNLKHDSPGVWALTGVAVGVSFAVGGLDHFGVRPRTQPRVAQPHRYAR